jgi:hypothetical protein
MPASSDACSGYDHDEAQRDWRIAAMKGGSRPEVAVLMHEALLI